MKLISVNVGEAVKTDISSLGITGIYKEPVSGPAFITLDGVDGDAVCDTSCHGGFDQAIYVYTMTDYNWWADRLGEMPSPGTFGENLTVSGIASEDIRIGDRLQFEGVELQVTAPRIPCRTLAGKMRDPKFVKRFRNARRPGFYCRVTRAGWVEAGETFDLSKYGGTQIGLIEVFDDYYERPADAKVIKRLLSSPIAERTRVELEARLLSAKADA